MAKTAVYFELANNGTYTVPEGKHLVVTNHRFLGWNIETPSTHSHTIVINNGEGGLVSGLGRVSLVGAVLPSGTVLKGRANASFVRQSISGYLVDN